MGLIRTVKEMISDSIMENQEAEYRILKKVFQNNTDKLYDYLMSRGSLDDFMEEIMSDDDDESRELHKMIISSILSVGDTERLYNYTLPAFNDLEVNGDVITMTLDDKEDIIEFFYDDRDISKDVLKSILRGDVDFGFYDESMDEQTLEYLIDDLNDDCISELKDIVKTQCLGKQISYNGDNGIFIDIMDSDKGIFTKDGMDEVFRTDRTLADFIYNCDELTDTTDNLQKIYNVANEDAINDENYYNIVSAVESFFGDKGEEFDTGRKYTNVSRSGQKYTITDYDYKIDVTSLYEQVIQWWLEGGYYDLDYWGSFEEVLKEYCADLSYGDAMSFRYVEYPDSDRFKTMVNERFFDYIRD